MNFDKNIVKYCCKKLKENSAGLLKIGKRTEILLPVTFLSQFFSVNSKKIYPEQLKNRSLGSILNQNKELITKLHDSTRKISSLEEAISVAYQCVTEEVKRGKTLFLKVKLEGGTIN